MGSTRHILGGHLVDPAAGIDGPRDLCVTDGVVSEVAAPGGLSGAGDATAPIDTVDARGCHVFPGFVDTHAHLREPGFEYKETIAHATRVAAASGITRLFAMPNTHPTCDTVAVCELVDRRAREAGAARVFPVGALTRDMAGEALAEMGELARFGVPAVSDAWAPVHSSELLRRGLEYARGVGLPVITVPQDPGLSSAGVMHEGAVSTHLGLRGIPSASEEISVARAIALTELTGCEVHISPISTLGAVRMVRDAHARGISVSAGTAPHYLCRTDADLAGYDTRLKVYPPLRPEADRDALQAAVADGTVAILASCHAPHARFEKEVEFDVAPFGIASLDTALSLTLQLVADKVLDLTAAVARWTQGPHDLFGTAAGPGTLAPGAVADLVVVDLEARWTVTGAASDASPFVGIELPGVVRHTLIGNTLISPPAPP